MSDDLMSGQSLFEVFETRDGSMSIMNTILGETYHSVHGALQESYHVFIKNGLLYQFENNSGPVDILEFGFGTGLNALLTFKEGMLAKRDISYHTIEKFPISIQVAENLKYHKLEELNAFEEAFRTMHTSDWSEEIQIGPYFRFTKYNTDFLTFQTNQLFDIIYHDAFAPQTHPEVWSEDFLMQCHELLKPGGILITYCAKGSFKRDLKKTGFKVVALPGPIGKREITRALR